MTLGKKEPRSYRISINVSPGMFVILKEMQYTTGCWNLAEVCRRLLTVGMIKEGKLQVIPEVKKAMRELGNPQGFKLVNTSPMSITAERIRELEDHKPKVPAKDNQEEQETIEDYD